MGLPSLQALVGWGGAFAFATHFSGGGLENYLGRGGGGLTSGVWEGVLFFVSQVVFYWILWVSSDKLQFQVAGMPCNALQCCGVLWSHQVESGVLCCVVVCCGV